MEKIYHIIAFILYYLKEVILSNLMLAIDILTPRYRMSPAVVEVKLRTRKEVHILALSNLITMTPGTLTLDYDEKENRLWVHNMYYRDPQKFEQKMEEMQSRIMKIF